jgi:CHAT domain-containing protein
MVLAPVARFLGRRRLLIVSDGALQYVPFAALPDPRRRDAPLGATHDIVNLPSASTLAVLRTEIAGRIPASRAVAVLADPVFDNEDPRATRRARAAHAARRSPQKDPRHSAHRAGEAGFVPRLPFTRQEAAGILALVRREESLRALDFAASRELATSRQLADFRVVHFATHGVINERYPELSGMILSLVDAQGERQDGFLRLHDIYNLELNADLVVLSACETGRGREVQGEGLIGLTRGFLYAGAAQVLVSLWKVNDEATAELMRLLYKGMLAGGLAPAAALRQAQLAMQKQRRWHSPYYWAGFVLHGDSPSNR